MGKGSYRYFLILGLISILSGCSGSPSGEAPEGWNPRAVRGKNLFIRSNFLEVPSIGIVTDIRRNLPGENQDSGLVVVGQKGAIIVDHNKEMRRRINFSEKGGRVVAVDLYNDGDWEFLNRGGGWQPVSLYGNKGQVVWSYDPSESPNDMAAGDLNGDGKLEFVVGCNGGGGVHLLDQEGNVKWRQEDSNVWHVEMLDVNDDGKLEIVHTNAKGLMKYRDADGKVVGVINTLKFFSDFSLCKWPTIEGPTHFLVSFDEKIWVLDVEGKANSQLDAPWAVDNYASGTPVRFDSRVDPFFAVMVEVRATWKRSILYIYDPTQKLLYQEILPVSTASVYALNDESSGMDTLLVGGQGVVWQYKLNENPPKTTQE